MQKSAAKLFAADERSTEESIYGRLICKYLLLVLLLQSKVSKIAKKGRVDKK